MITRLLLSNLPYLKKIYDHNYKISAETSANSTTLGKVVLWRLFEPIQPFQIMGASQLIYTYRDYGAMHQCEGSSNRYVSIIRRDTRSMITIYQQNQHRPHVWIPTC
jgi:hypothetical protein